MKKIYTNLTGGSSKRQKKLIIAMVVMLLLCAGVLMGANALPAKVKTAAKGFLAAYYDISAYDLYSWNKTGDIPDVAELSAQAKEQSVCDAIGLGQQRLYGALNEQNGRTLRLEGVQLQKTLDARDSYLLGYRFTAQVGVYDPLGKRLSTSTQEGTIQYSTRGGQLVIVELSFSDSVELLALVGRK